MRATLSLHKNSPRNASCCVELKHIAFLHGILLRSSTSRSASSRRRRRRPASGRPACTRLPTASGPRAATLTAPPTAHQLRPLLLLQQDAPKLVADEEEEVRVFPRVAPHVGRQRADAASQAAHVPTANQRAGTACWPPRRRSASAGTRAQTTRSRGRALLGRCRTC